MDIAALLVASGALIVALIALFKKPGENVQIDLNTEEIRNNRIKIEHNKIQADKNGAKIDYLDQNTPKAIEKTNGEVWLAFGKKTIYKTETKKK